MKKISILVASILIVSCGTKNTNTQHNSPVETNNNEVSTTNSTLLTDEIPAKRSKYWGSETVYTDLIHTKLEVNFDWSKSRMNGIATITAKPHFYATDSLILDAKGMDILDVSLADKKLKYVYDSSFLKISLDRVYTRNENYTLKIKYVAKPDERATSGSAAITSDKGLYFINPKGEDKNKMPHIWTQGETEASSVWFPTIDAPNVKTTQEIFITVENKFTTLSNGKLISSKQNSDGTRTDYWKQDLVHAPYLFMMGVGEFKVVKDFYTRLDGTKMEVNYYVEPEWEQHAKAIFGETPAMITYFSKLLGVEYPWDKYHQIIVRDYVSGAMENTGAVIFGDYAYKTTRELLDENDQSTIAHELFHHWFGDLVTCESWSNLTLNESFANYSQYLWDEHRYGLDEAAYNAEIEADGYFQSAQSGGYHNLVWFDYDDKEQMFDGHTYNKGGRILHMLRCYLGDEAFFKAIHNYLSNNKFKSAEFNQLRIAFEEVCGEDLNWFFNQWYLGAAHPILEIVQTKKETEKMVTISIDQKQNLEVASLFKLPMEIAIFDSKGKHIHQVIVENLHNEFTFKYEGDLKCVITDDQQMLLGKLREEKSTSQYVYQYYHSTTYKGRKDGLQFGANGTDSTAQKLILDALNDPFWYIRSMAIEKASKLKDENKLKGLATLKEILKNDNNSQVRASAINFLAKNSEGKELEEILVNCLQTDQSYTVISAALRELGQINPELALEKAKMFEKEKSSKMLAGIGQLYQGHAQLDAFPFFENSLKNNSLQGFDQLSMMNSLTVFMVRLNDIETLEKALPIYDYLKSNGGMYTKMFLPQNIKYLQGYISQKVEEMNLQIEAYEKNKDMVYANQTRQLIKRYQELSEKLKIFEITESATKMH
ncbi:MAG: M1 family metallopeptidase [Flavobacteriia bacterium]|nr:M1 family metallopeptidase [Flavobacteriia bacterium]